VEYRCTTDRQTDRQTERKRHNHNRSTHQWRRATEQVERIDGLKRLLACSCFREATRVMASTENFYAILGVSHDVAKSRIKRAYLLTAKRYVRSRATMRTCRSHTAFCRGAFFFVWQVSQWRAHLLLLLAHAHMHTLSLLARYHPDRNPEGGDRFREIGEAYRVLSNEKLRRIYDQCGEVCVSQCVSLSCVSAPSVLRSHSSLIYLTLYQHNANKHETRSHAHTHTHTHTLSLSPPTPRTHIHTYIQTYRHTHTHTHTYTKKYTHTHTHVRAYTCSPVNQCVRSLHTNLIRSRRE
jgi:DnaJ domain